MRSAGCVKRRQFQRKQPPEEAVDWAKSAAVGQFVLLGFDLVHCAQASRADRNRARAPILRDRHFANAGLPATSGFVERVGNIVPKASRLATDVTLGHNEPFPFQRVTQYERDE